MSEPDDSRILLAIQAGADPIPREQLTPELEHAIREALRRALAASHAALLAPSGSALDGVEAAIRVFEDAPEFNAAHGAAFDRAGRIALDAAIMEGVRGAAGLSLTRPGSGTLSRPPARSWTGQGMS